MSLPVLERRRMPKSQLEVMSIDWERSQGWLSVTLLPPSFRRPDPVDPKLLPGTRESWHFSRSTSWSISTISHIPVSSLVTWDCLMWAKIMAGLSKNAISSVWLSVSFRFGNFLTLLPVCQRVPFLFFISLCLRVLQLWLMTREVSPFPSFDDYFFRSKVGKVVPKESKENVITCCSLEVGFQLNLLKLIYLKTISSIHTSQSPL